MKLSKLKWRRALVAAFAMLASLAAEPQPTPAAQPAPAVDAESTAKEQPAVEKRTVPARFFDPDDGKLDLSSFLENPHGFLPIPIIVTEPAVGYGGGAAGMFLRPRSEAGEEGWAFPNISAAGAFATENGTRGAFGGDASRWRAGRLRTLFGAGAGRVNLDFYGLGPDPSSLDQKVRYSLDFTGAVAQLNWQIAPGSPWAVGLRYVYADVNPMLRDDPLFPDLVDRVSVKISALTPILEFDTRDNVFTPTRGVYAESSWLASRNFFGATVDFERFTQVLMGWYPATSDVTLGVRGNYTSSSDATPFFLRPFVQLRGVPAMKYQGDKAASIEVEARWQFHGRWSVVAFAGGGTTRSDRDSFTATQNVGSGGAGFRYELARKFGLNAGIDVARSRNTTAVYLVVGNAWFRP